MTTVTVSVDATPRIARFEFSAPMLPQGMVYGYSEVLLQSPATPTAGAAFMNVKPSPMTPAPKEGEPVTYGTMAGNQIARGIPAVMDETVEVDGVSISFKTVLDAMGAFFDKWRQEDEAYVPPPPPPPPPLP